MKTLSELLGTGDLSGWIQAARKKKKLTTESTSPIPKKDKHKELSDAVAKWRKKHKMKVANTAIGKGSGIKKKTLTRDKARMVGESLTQIRKRLTETLTNR